MLTLVQVVHLGGLSALTRNLLHRYVKKQIRQRRVWGSIVYFWRKASTNGNLKDGCHGFRSVPSTAFLAHFAWESQKSPHHRGRAALKRRVSRPQRTGLQPPGSKQRRPHPPNPKSLSFRTGPKPGEEPAVDSRHTAVILRQRSRPRSGRLPNGRTYANSY